MLALKAGGRGDVTKSHVLWSFDNGPDVPTPVTDGTYLYVVNDHGIMFCLDAKTGQGDLRPAAAAAGTYSGSPVLADGKIYITNEDGVTASSRPARSSRCWRRTTSTTTRSARRRFPTGRSSSGPTSCCTPSGGGRRRIETFMRFVPYEALGDLSNIIVDGSANAHTVLTLSHWPASGTPAALSGDTSTAIVFNYLEAPAFHVEAAAVSNNHFDEDGLLGIFALLTPDEALKRRDLMLDVASAGDFGTYHASRGGTHGDDHCRPRGKGVLSVRASPRHASPRPGRHRRLSLRLGRR